MSTASSGVLLQGWCFSWLKYWTKLMNMLGDPLRKEEFITLFTKYADQILTTRINGYMTHIDSTFGNPSCKNCDESDMIECSDQGLRNMIPVTITLTH